MRLALRDLPGWQSFRRGRALRMLVKAHEAFPPKPLGAFLAAVVRELGRAGLPPWVRLEGSRLALVLCDAGAGGVTSEVAGVARVLSERARALGLPLTERG